MTHEPRLTRSLRALLQAQRVAALGTLGEDGAPLVSMVPYAIVASEGCIALHVSGLGAHSGNMRRTPRVSLLVMQPEMPGEPVHALPRVTLEGRADTLDAETPLWRACRAAYLERFPEAEPMTQLGDFRFVVVHPSGARQVAGFGAARSVDANELAQVLRG